MAGPHKTTSIKPYQKKWGDGERPRETTTTKCKINIKNRKTKLPKNEEYKEISLTKSNLSFTKIHNLTEEIYTNQTGKFPIRSSANNQYLCICYDQDSNSILATSIPTRKQE